MEAHAADIDRSQLLALAADHLRRGLEVAHEGGHFEGHALDKVRGQGHDGGAPRGDETHLCPDVVKGDGEAEQLGCAL